MGGARSILHIDMNAFYVSVELLRHPDLVGQPVVVGGTGGRGVVSAASYEARQFGIHSAMSSAMALRLCPHAVFLHPDMDYYLEYSRQLREIFESFTPLVESISVDEAFLDVTGAQNLLGDARTVATSLRHTVTEKTSLPCTVGIAPNKFLAKLASEFAKPKALPDRIDPGHGIYEIHPGEELAFLLPLPIKNLWGVGPATRKKLENLGIYTVGDLADIDVELLCRAIGDAHGRHLHDLAHGVDDRVVEPDRVAKSIGNEETFSHDISSIEQLRSHLVKLCDSVSRRTREANVAAGTLMLKVKFSSFETITRSVTPQSALTTGPSMVAALEPLLASIDCSQGVRLLGVHAQKLIQNNSASPTLFDLDDSSAEEIEEQWVPASRAIDSIVSKFGEGVIRPASALGAPQPGRRPFGPHAGDTET